MEIMAIVIVVFAVIIGLVIGCGQHLSQDEIIKEAAELMALNAEQEATNLRGQAEREAIYYSMKLRAKSKSLKKKHHWRLKRKPENTVKKWTLNLSQNVKNSSKSKVV